MVALPVYLMRRTRLLSTVAAAGVLAACDAAVPSPVDGGEGFGAASLHFTLSDSTGVERAAGFTEYVALAPGDSSAAPFRLVVWDDGVEAEYAGKLRAVCSEAGAGTYTITASGGPVWQLSGRCNPHPETGTWVRLDDGESTEGGTYETGIAVP